MSLMPKLRRADETRGDSETEAAVSEAQAVSEAPAEPAAQTADIVPFQDEPAATEHLNPLDALIVNFRHAFRNGRRQWREASQHQGWVRGLLAARPSSVDDQLGYLYNRGWLADGHEGGPAHRLGEAYHVGIGVPGVAYGNTVSAILARPFRFTCAWLLIMASLFGGLQLLAGMPLPSTALVTTGITLLPLGWVLAVLGLLAFGRYLAADHAQRVAERAASRAARRAAAQGSEA